MNKGIENDTQKDDARDVSVATATQTEGSKKRPKRIMKYVALSVSAIILLAVGVYGFFFLTTPSHIRTPAFQHYHFRTQLVVNGTPVDFSKDAFQGKKSTTVGCSAEVGSVPIDFHDNIDQMTHIHWDGMTGGEFLKYYGWNLIGGNDNSLGNRYDNGLIPSPVATYGNVLPELPADTNFYVYIGNADGYRKRNGNSSYARILKPSLERRVMLARVMRFHSIPLIGFSLRQRPTAVLMMGTRPTKQKRSSLVSITSLAMLSFSCSKMNQATKKLLPVLQTSSLWEKAPVEINL